jgi:putative ABC transport system ATP-binding protein
VTASVVSASDLRKSFRAADRGPEVEVLRGISLDIAAGEFVSIVGPSGSGKSTLLTCLSGLEPASSGSVAVAGSRLDALDRNGIAKLRRDHIGFVFQQYNLIPSLTARENVALPARLAHRALSARAVSAALASVGLTDRAHHRPAALSGGQQQRVAIARVLACTPDVVFADEPTGALDSTASATVLRLLREVADSGRAVVMVTHDLSAATLADRVLVIRDGVVHHELRAPSVDDLVRAVQSGADGVVR